MNLIIALIFCFFLYIIQNKIYASLWNRGLTITIQFDDSVVTEGESTYLTEVISYNNFLLLPILQVKLQAPKSFLFEKEMNSTVTDFYYRNDTYTLMPYQKITRKLPFCCSKRGCYLIDKLDIVSRTIFYTTLLADHHETNALLTVLPKKIQMGNIPSQFLKYLGSITKQTNLFPDPFEFKGIREYQSHDRMRSINWKTSAKLGSLYVNTYDSTVSKEIYILLNLETNSIYRKEELQEESIRIADTISDLIMKQKIPIHFFCNGLDQFTKKPSKLLAGCGKNHGRQISMALARIDLNLTMPSTLPLLQDIKKKDPAQTEVILISNYRKDDLISNYHSLSLEGYSLHWIIPEYLGTQLNMHTVPNILKWEVDYHAKIS